MTRNQRIKFCLQEAGISQEQLAKVLGISQAGVGKQLNKKDDIDSWAFLTAVSNLTGKGLRWIVSGEDDPEDLVYTSADSQQSDAEIRAKIDMLATSLSEPYTEYLAGNRIRPVAVTVDRHGKELISYVPVRAQAGYMKGHADPHYIEQLPAFGLPILKQGTYRMFEVSGDSMLQMGGGGLHDGDIVIAQFLEDIFTMRDNRVYVVVSTDGVVVKRCLNRLKEKENPVLVCKSDNKNGQHPDLIVRPHQIIEVWELKAYISKQLSFATDIWQVLNDVQVQVALMDEKIKKIEEDRLLPG